MARFQTATADYPATPGQEEALRHAEEALRNLQAPQDRIAQIQGALEMLTTAAEGVPAPEIQGALAQGAQLLATHGGAISQSQVALNDRIAETKSAAFWCQH